MELELRKKIREILSEAFLSINELDIDWEHVNQRYDERIRPSVLDVGFEEGPATPLALNTVVVGKKSLSPAQKQEILNKLQMLEKVKLPKGKTYGIKIYDLYIDPKTVSFNSEDDMALSKGKTLVYIVKHGNSYSVGNEVWVATDENGRTEVKTLMFRRGYFPPEKTPGKRWDVSIKNLSKILPANS